MPNDNLTLTKAKTAKNDEFYTRLEDVEKEILGHDDYMKEFAGKTVLCNCNDTEESAFFIFFKTYFGNLNLKKVITTAYDKDGGPAYKMTLASQPGTNEPVMSVSSLKGNGDFRSDECVGFLKEADIVVTNPPFSLFRDFISLLTRCDKKFLVIGNRNALTYKDIFPLVREDRMWTGYNLVKKFDTKDGERAFGNIGWFTNMETEKKYTPLELTCEYKGHESLYPKYDGQDVINVSRTAKIPKDYYGVMGVPISFIERYDPEQFEIVGEANHGSDSQYDIFKPKINGKLKFKRLLIKRKSKI